MFCNTSDNPETKLERFKPNTNQQTTNNLCRKNCIETLEPICEHWKAKTFMVFVVHFGNDRLTDKEKDFVWGLTDCESMQARQLSGKLSV